MGYRALIIEDDGVIADVLRMKLERGGYQVTVAANQRDALHLLDDLAFDFALLDLRLPTHPGDMDPNSQVGFDILHHIRQRFMHDKLPVIVMTAYEETSQTAVRALRAGANDYITKPFDDSPVSLDEKLGIIVRSIEEARLAPSADTRHKIVFTNDGVTIDGIAVSNPRSVDLLLLLASRTLRLSRDREAGDDPRMTGRALAKAMGVQEATVRQYVTRFRTWIAAEFESRGMGRIADDDIIRNVRDWRGYELNFAACYISRE